MLAKDKSNLKIEEIRMHKHHEIHRVKPLMPALCRIRQGKKVINWETHSLTVDNNQIILFPCGYEFYIANYPEAGLYLACLLYTSDAADDTPCVDLCCRRIIKKKKII